METGNELIDRLVGEVRGLIENRSILGEPITIGEITVIPVASYGFGFGGGAGTGTNPGSKDEGTGSGGGAGGGIRPVALVIVDKDGARVEKVQSGKASLGEAIAAATQRVIEKQKESTKEE